MKKTPHRPPVKRSRRPTVARTVKPVRRLPEKPSVPGEYFLRPEPIVANADKPIVEVEVANHGDRPVQVGSHFHFFEVNRALVFERSRAYGMRLNIPAGTAVRFEPGQHKTVSLIPLGGRREVWGLNGLVNGVLRT